MLEGGGGTIRLQLCCLKQSLSSLYKTQRKIIYTRAFHKSTVCSPVILWWTGMLSIVWCHRIQCHIALHFPSTLMYSEVQQLQSPALYKSLNTVHRTVFEFTLERMAQVNITGTVLYDTTS